MKKTIIIIVGLLLCLTTFANARDNRDRHRRHKDRGTSIRIGYNNISISVNRHNIRSSIRIPTYRQVTHQPTYRSPRHSRGTWEWTTKKIIVNYKTIIEERWIEARRTKEKVWDHRRQKWVRRMRFIPGHWKEYVVEIPVYKTVREKVWVEFCSHGQRESSCRSCRAPTTRHRTHR